MKSCFNIMEWIEKKQKVITKKHCKNCVWMDEMTAKFFDLEVGRVLWMAGGMRWKQL